MNVTFRYGNQVLVDNKILWADVHSSPKAQEIMRVSPEDIQKVISFGRAALSKALSQYPELFFVALRQEEEVCYASPSPFTPEGYAKTTGVTTDITAIDPAFHPYWRAVEYGGRGRALVRMGTDATWLMLARRG